MARRTTISGFPIRRLAIRQTVGCFFLLWFVAVPVMLILNMLERRFLNVAMMVIYMGLLLSGASFNPWTLLAYASRIRCDQAGIEIKYWLRPSPRRHAWTEIEGLEVGASALDHVYTIRSGKGALRFSTVKLNEESTLIKTILERASLHFVEGTVGRATYRHLTPSERETESGREARGTQHAKVLEIAHAVPYI